MSELNHILPAHDAWLCLETDPVALQSNLAEFRRRVAPPTRMMAVVKSEGYGHGLVTAARAFLAGGADWLGVHSLSEAAQLREADVVARVLVLGPTTAAEAAVAADLGCDITAGSLSGLAGAVAVGRGRVHLKVETGVNRQGLVEAELDQALAMLGAAPDVELVGVSSHFADIEDTTDHDFARAQRDRFDAWLVRLEGAGRGDLLRHMTCSAATLLWPESHRDLARVGISAYGLWPSRETRVAARSAGCEDLDLKPALRWLVRVAQIRDVPAAETVGYGRTWMAPAASRIAVLPVGYADGFPRSLSGRAHVLIRGRRAPVVGRICMNLCMVDVTRIEDAAAGDDAVLLGSQGDDAINADQLADWLDTINYEVLTLPGPSWRRVEKDS